MSAAAEPAIVVDGLRKSYGQAEAIRGISFEVGRGEVFGLLGPNGAGKTTTVEILEGYRRRSAGSVAVLGDDPGTAGEGWRRRIGIVLQSSGIWNYVTAREVVAHWARLADRPRPVDDVLGMVGLAEAAEQRVGTLSGGQMRRLDVALAVVGDPELIFLDEPTTGFDPAARRQAWELVRSLRDLGTTVLLTTHYLDEAQELCDRVAILSGGRIVAEGPPGELGPSSARTVVRWRTASMTAAEPARSEEVEDPTELVHRLTGAALGGDPDDALTSLTVTRRSLEDVYLELVGEEPGA
ncbi:MAG: ABC transporter ATP-binding protein [Baekduia sp.]